MVLLNPGPVNVSERVRQALLHPDVCHRESEFTELLHGIQAKLLKLFVPGAEADYAAVVLTGSWDTARRFLEWEARGEAETSALLPG